MQLPSGRQGSPYGIVPSQNLSATWKFSYLWPSACLFLFPPDLYRRVQKSQPTRVSIFTLKPVFRVSWGYTLCLHYFKKLLLKKKKKSCILKYQKEMRFCWIFFFFFAHPCSPNSACYKNIVKKICWYADRADIFFSWWERLSRYGTWGSRESPDLIADVKQHCFSYMCFVG